MWIVHLVCSGAECTEELEAAIEDLDELDQLNCPCGYGLLVLSISEVELLKA